jgi:hypothetical protein
MQWKGLCKAAELTLVAMLECVEVAMLYSEDEPAPEGEAITDNIKQTRGESHCASPALHAST